MTNLEILGFLGLFFSILNYLEQTKRIILNVEETKNNAGVEGRNRLSKPQRFLIFYTQFLWNTSVKMI